MRILERVQPFFTSFEEEKKIKNLNIWMSHKMVVLILGYALDVGIEPDIIFKRCRSTFFDNNLVYV